MKRAGPGSATGSSARSAIRRRRSSARAGPDALSEATMKLVLFQTAGAEIAPGVLTDRGVVSVTGAVPSRHTPQATMEAIIDEFDTLRPDLQRLAASAKALPLGEVRLRPPLPRPGKILAYIASYCEHGAMEARPLNMFLNNTHAVIGPDDTTSLPDHVEPRSFLNTAELPV